MAYGTPRAYGTRTQAYGTSRAYGTRTQAYGIPDPRAYGTPTPRRRPRRRGFLKTMATFLVLLTLLVVGGWFYLDFSLHRTAALADYPGRAGQGAGENWLIIGSDNRDGLTFAQQEQLAAAGNPTGAPDTAMIFHMPGDGAKPTLVSLLRNSYLDVPGHGMNTLAAAYGLGGTPLVVRTVEQATSLRIDHFADVGFGGLIDIVNDVGGVNLCLPAAIDDPLAGLNLGPGCQLLNGAQALGYVRTESTPQADLERVVHQRDFLTALLRRIASPSVYFNPGNLFPLLVDAPSVVTIDNGDHLLDLIHLAFAMRDAPVGTTVPIMDTEDVPGVGNVVVWDQNKAALLFSDLRTNTTVAANLISSQ
ncbi:MAG TPA: LCP family protein [Pseudonocardiaceae bacterium]|nr:LCP family protein [Pseudonocardiaceae bacterium]